MNTFSRNVLSRRLPLALLSCLKTCLLFVKPPRWEGANRTRTLRTNGVCIVGVLPNCIRLLSTKLKHVGSLWSKLTLDIPRKRVVGVAINIAPIVALHRYSSAVNVGTAYMQTSMLPTIFGRSTWLLLPASVHPWLVGRRQAPYRLHLRMRDKPLCFSQGYLTDR